MAYATVRSGSSGSSVSALQELLNQNGYGLSVDGVFGSKTAAAVRDYQSKNSLAVDGIVGTNTWNALTGGAGLAAGGTTESGASSGSTKTTSQWLADYETPRPDYQQSQAVIDAANKLTEIEGAKPGEYQSAYADQIDSLLDQILNRDAFSYDFNADPMYHQYKDNYTQQGKMAMMDTMGQAAGLTGGYGNSYAQTVGQQAYQGHLQQLNNVIPELYNAAYGQYRDEGDDMMNNMGLLRGLDDTDYGRYRDTVGDWKDELAYFYTKQKDMSADDYNKYLNDQDAWEKDRAYWYQKSRDETSDSQWQQEFDFAKAQASKSSSGGSGGSGGSGSSKSTGSSGTGSSSTSTGFSGTNNMGIVPTSSGSSTSKVTITNKMDANQSDWIYISGLGRISMTEFSQYKNSGKIKQKNNGNGTVTWVKA